MSDLVAFLQARLDEDEASAAIQDECQSGLTHPFDMNNPCDPARVLAEVAAKRVIVDMHRPWGGSLPDGTIDCQICGWRRFGCLTLLALAQPYADHPDFDPAWRLEGTDRG